MIINLPTSQDVLTGWNTISYSRTNYATPLGVFSLSGGILTINQNMRSLITYTTTFRQNNNDLCVIHVKLHEINK